MDTNVELLRKENADLMGKVQKLTTEFKDLKAKMASTTVQSQIKDFEYSVQFFSNEYEDIKSSKETIEETLKRLSCSLNNISSRAADIEREIQEIQDYSYQYNLKIIGVPLSKQRESALQTSELCVKLFNKAGASKITINDIDIAHCVPNRRRNSASPPTIICKFTRRLAKEQFMAVRKHASKLTPADLDLATVFPTSKILLFDHLTPKMQDFLQSCKRYQKDQGFKFYWVKNSSIYLRKNEACNPIPIKSYEDLDRLELFYLLEERRSLQPHTN